MDHIIPASTLLATCTFYSIVFVDFELKSIPAYNLYIRNLRRRHHRNVILACHLTAGVCELLRWHLRALWCPAPQADGLDMILCLVQAITNQMLVKDLSRGVPTWTRPSYQAGAILRPILTCIAWNTGSAALHQGSIKALNSFVYARALIFGFNNVMQSTEMTHASMYNIGVFVSAILAVAEGGAFTYVAHVYVLIVFGLAALNQWTSHQAAKKQKLSIAMQDLVSVLEWLGYAELPTLKKLRKESAVSDAVVANVVRPNDEWTDPNVAEVMTARTSVTTDTVVLPPAVTATTDTVTNNEFDRAKHGEILEKAEEILEHT